MPLSDPTYARLKRLQVWTGVLPVGLFLVSHLAINSRAIAGPGAFDGAVATIGRIPGLAVLEAVAIALPMLAHVALGVVLGLSPQAAGDDRGYPRPWMLLIQRATGFFLVVYVMFHLSATRLSTARLEGEQDLFDLMARQLANPTVLAFHTAGVLAAAFHFGNGLVGLAGPWGLNAGTRAVSFAGRIGFVAFVALSLAGVHALLAFVHPAFRWLAP